MIDVLYCWRDTSHEVWISHSDGYRHKEIKHSDISRKAMKDYAINHIEEFAENTISFLRPNTDRQYYISNVVSHIWQGWDEYYKFVNGLNIQSAKLNEYKKFLEEFKKADFKNSVYFDFKEMHFDS